MQSIKKFYFQNARYLAEDHCGNCLFMCLDYKGNNFELEVVKLVNGEMEKLREEAAVAAKGLLGKKHNVNMVERLEKVIANEK